jgi:SSS family transporter
VDDYFRSGCRGTWWLVGTSAAMGLSAWTFTGAAGIGFNYGLSIVALSGTSLLSRFILIFWLAPRFRQMRVISAPEVIKNRFGVTSQQVFGSYSLLFAFIGGGITIYAVAVFCAPVFGLPIKPMIVVVGGVVLFYSLIGGRWAVMATDFIQSLILFPVAILVGLLSLHAVGGIGGLIAKIKAQGLMREYALIKSPGFVDAPIDFSLNWFVALLLLVTCSSLSIGSGVRYFSVKDGREARKAAVLELVFSLVVMTLFFIPPMVARVLYADQVNAVDITVPAEAAYAVVALKLLPAGMSALVVVTIMSATMSTMDTFLNVNAAIFINDVYPALCRAIRKTPTSGQRLFLYGQLCTLVLGSVIIANALFLSSLREIGLFSIMQFLVGTLAPPMNVPLLLGLFIKRVPWWSMLVSMAAGFLGSLLGLLSGNIDWWFFEAPWMWHTKAFVSMGSAAAAFFASGLFWRTANPVYRKQVAVFFQTMKTPIDFESEVGQANDLSQFKTVGAFAVVLGVSISLLALLPNPWTGRLCFVFVGSFGLVIGSLFMWCGSR